MKKSSIILQISQDTGVHIFAVKQVVDSFVEQLKECIKNEDPVIIKEFAEFGTYTMKPRKNVDFWRGKVIHSPATTLPKVTFHRSFKKQVKERAWEKRKESPVSE